MIVDGIRFPVNSAWLSEMSKSVRWDVQIGQDRRTRKILWQKDKKDFVIYDPESDCHVEDFLLVGSSIFVEMIKSDEKVGFSADDYMINGVESAVYFEDFLALISPRANLLPEQEILPNRMDLLICKLYSSGKGRL